MQLSGRRPAKQASEPRSEAFFYLLCNLMHGRNAFRFCGHKNKQTNAGGCLSPLDGHVSLGRGRPARVGRFVQYWARGGDV
jgi:hypothetical protein